MILALLSFISFPYKEYLPGFLANHFVIEQKGNEKINSYVVETSSFSGKESFFDFKIKFLATFFDEFRFMSLPKTKHGYWKISARMGNFTIRLFDLYKLNNIVFKEIPQDYTCSIKKFRILFAKRGHVFAKSRTFNLNHNNSYAQFFDLSNECDQSVDAIKIEVLDNWGSLDETCLTNYFLT